MTTHKNGDLAWECDECGELSEGHDPDDFQGAWARLKEEGWRCFPKDGVGKWQHFCRDCVGVWRREQSGVDKHRDAIGSKRRDWMAQRRKARPAGDPPQRPEPRQRTEPSRRRSNDRPPWD